MSSFALAVDPTQVPKAREHWKKAVGPGVTFANDGTVHFASKRDRDRMLNQIPDVDDKDSYY